MEGTEHSLEDFDSIFISFGDLNITAAEEKNEFWDDIPHVLQSIYEVFEYNNIPVQEDSSTTDRKCIKAFKYLLLNTAFTCCNHLTTDPTNGYLVGRWDYPMSPYFLTRILCYLGYEQILAESLLHMPLDLCIEILTIVKKHVFLLDFERGFDLIIAIIFNCHKNLIVAWKIGTQSMNFNDKCERLMIYTQKFMSFLIKPKFLRLNEVKNLEKSERIGIIFKKTIALTYKCLTNNEKISLPREITEHYEIVFGDDPLHKSKQNFAPQLRMLNEEFMHIIVKKLKEIDNECYNSWMELEADGNSSVSLQLSIRNDLYHFIEFLKIHKNFVHYEHLIQLLKTFDPWPVNIVSALNFDALRYGTIEMKMESIKHVISRYREWDHHTFDLIQRNRILLDLDDVSYLIDYLVLILQKPGQQEHKARVCVAIRKVLFQQRVRETFNIKFYHPFDFVEDDLLQCVDPAYEQDNFKTFIANNLDLKSPENLRTTFSFLLNNPGEVFTILIELMIGVSDYERTSLPIEDYNFFHPVFKLFYGGKRFTLYIIKKIVTTSDKWDINKLSDLVNFLINAYYITANDFIECVFIDWLENKRTNLSMFVKMLKFVRKFIVRKCTTDLNGHKLHFNFANRLTDFRTDLLLPRSVSNKLINEIDRTAKPLFALLNSINEFLIRNLEPIDRSKSPFAVGIYGWLDNETEFLPYILDELEDGCLTGIERARTRVIGGIAINPDAPTRWEDLNYLEDHFARYALIKFSESEMIEFSNQLAYDLWEDYDYNSTFDAFDDIVHLSIEAALYFLEFPALSPPESFACLMRGIAGFTDKFSKTHLKEFNRRYLLFSSFSLLESSRKLREMYGLYESLRDNLLDLQECVMHSTFYPLYESLLEVIKDPLLNDEPRGVALYKIQTALLNFGNGCLKIPHSEVRFNREPSAEALGFKRAHDFINECLNVEYGPTQDASQYHSLCATFKLLSNE